MSRWNFGRKFVREVQTSGFEYADPVTTSSLVGNGVIPARPRQQIYAKYQQMLSDPLVSGALRLHVTAALGGHETTGDYVFIESKPDTKGDASKATMVKEIATALGPMFNRVAQQVAYNGVAFGDSYARMYVRKRKGEGGGVTALQVDEMLLPTLVQPYEKAGQTVVCMVSVGPKWREELVMDQIARLKMPRLNYVPQPVAVEKAWRTALAEDDPEKMPLMPSLAGGSFLVDAESQFDKFQAAMTGLVGQRVLDSIDESIFTAETDGMSAEDKDRFLASVKKMLTRSKQIADDAVKSGQPHLARVRHILPVARAKQLLQVMGVNGSGGGGGGRAGNIGIEDVLLHAKLLCGSLGIDISMLGFADLMSGGLGEGGFFRTSAQSAERSRCIRTSLAEFFDHVIEVHVAYRYGLRFAENERPWQVNFFGGISALEAERQRTQLDAVNAALLVTQAMTQLKDSGLDEKSMAHFMEKIMKMDAEDAVMYARDLVKARTEAIKREQQQNAFGGAGGGGPGGFGEDDLAQGNGGGEPGEEEAPPGAPKPVPLREEG